MDYVLPSVQLGLVMVLSSTLNMGWAQAVESEEVAEIPPLTLDTYTANQPATTVQEWVAQLEAIAVPVTGVRLNQSDSGLEIILETAEGQTLSIDSRQFRTEGDRLIADIPNATLAQAFNADNPTAEIANIRVVQIGANTLQVSVTGSNALPTEPIILRANEFAYRLNPPTDRPGEEIEIVVTTAQEGYRVPNATSVTRTPTPIRDIPQSIQVVPQEVLQDQRATNLREALRNVSGVTSGGPAFGTYDQLILRGFLGSNTGNYRRNGVEFPNFVGFSLNPNTERVEVLKGPASVLFGDLAPGGVVNLVTKQPLSVPFAEIEANVGSFGYYRGAVDLSGPLNPERTVLYRLNVAYEDANSFRDFINNRTFFIAPVISWQITDRTRWAVELEYNRDDRITDVGLSIPGVPFSRIRQFPIRRLLNEPGDEFESRYLSILSTLEHNFSQNWQIRNVFNFVDASRNFVQYTNPDALREDGRTLERSQSATEQDITYYLGQIDVTGRFATGPVRHEVVFGTDYLYRKFPSVNFNGQEEVLLDILDPDYGNDTDTFTLGSSFTNPERRFGVFVQDTISFSDRFKLLLGGRYNNALLQQTNRLTDTLIRDQTVENFSPRLGIVYQPADWVSLYASYSRSFEINSGTDAAGNPFDPTFGTQYEIGAKTEFFNGALGATLSLFKIKRDNVLTPDPTDTRFSVQTGEQESQGIELDISGRITPNWSIVASYSYLDAKITRDNRFPEGNRLPSAAPHRFSLWTKYDFDGSLQGLSLGGGIFYVGERWESLNNVYQLPSYTTVDLFAAYRFNPNLTAQVNFKNAFDRRYYEGTFGAVHPGTPRSITASVVYQF
ncbi:TonB-dependent siderophore receptor [Desertifilum sp. FACHB-1129]|uniref:Ferrichrome-iron receptor n=1 Tax=Desertifilum tharense IPPAS B-1220 TaxID=1781255 RepID=A0A1E5QK96_9CYAN|nr:MULTISPECIES: TonB-dependent siderophore receptor [Desertifilum]MDA0211091.1 TonB-dependent siderophore receptor [Cyanobacteria bacterium FC1]MBD2314173.1 TonB-dependent siderophore receptor [Desertifilum sp. FACHB-1129]MBD2320138.1 TonB-dependent siderophore receptor [Desertifilum sp. FACHB-866]MBD2330266.1 TonB-dependent siderophore receptor [Desertifilum sp. FACHB-868]OEJ75102.1 hypothetical protein BH720_10245 [Desertifilum tharense IPPAS B-1220]